MKKRIKKRNLVIFTILLILIICNFTIYLTKNNQKDVTIKQNLQKEEKNQTKKERIISNILVYNTEEIITEEFLEWITEQYSLEILEKIETSLKESENNTKIWHQLTGNSLYVLFDEYKQISSNRIKKLTTKAKRSEAILSFIGDVSLADNWYIMPKYDERGKKIYGILSENVVEILKSSDITIANNEFTISNRGEKMPNKFYTFRGKSERLNIYNEMGVNLVTLANNHIYDFGEIAFNDSLEALEQYGIPYIGAGRNIEEATQPYYYIINGYKIGFVNATRAEKFILTPEATTTTGGVFRCYNPMSFIDLIQKTKKNSDYVIALVHWGKEDSSELEQVQIETSKQYIDAGADIIIGSHAHTLQGIDFYQDKAIIYNLGDFIFNNETKDTGIFQLKIDSDGIFSYYFKPCKEENEYTYLLSGEEQKRVLSKIQFLSPNITIKEDGEFYSRNNTSQSN